MQLPAKRQWTILLYTMADQNALRDFANDTLIDISRAPASDQVKTAAQVTYHSSVVHPIRRYDFEFNPVSTRMTDVENHLQYVPRKDISPRRNLVDFIRWGIRTYPAERYAVVLQGHAWGADYTIPAFNLTHESRGTSKREVVRLILGSPRSKHHLSNKDLQRALMSAMGRRKIDLLGMDSCLMSMAEILYELHQSAEFTIAPEGLGPIRGWPFFPILKTLKDSPSMGAAELGANVLNHYAAKYRDWGGDIKLTISLCSLQYSQELMDAMKGFVRALRNALQDRDLAPAVINARLRCPYFRIPPYIDLQYFCRLLANHPAVQPDSDLNRESTRMVGVLKDRFVAKVALKRGRSNSFGLSIYFPKWRIGERRPPTKWVKIPWTDPMATPGSLDEGIAKINAAYADHEFADQSGWKAFLVEFLQARMV